VVGGLDTVLGEKDPQRVHLSQQATGELSGLVLTIMIVVDEPTESGIPGPPCSPGGRGLRHMTQPLQLSQRPGPTGRQVWLEACCQAPCGADEMGHAGLPGCDPVLIHPVAIADQEPLPVVYKGGEGFFGAARM